MTATTKRRKAHAGTWPDAPESPGTSDCGQCGAGFDALLFTRGPQLCPRCLGRADLDMIPTPRSDPFWLLTPQETTRLEHEIVRLADQAKQIDAILSGLIEEFGDGSDEYDTAIDEYYTIERERLLLHMLHAASRQAGPTGGDAA